AEREDREAPEHAAAEQVEHAEDAARVLIEEIVERVSVDAGRGDMAADAVHRQQGEREQDALAKIGNPKYVRYGFKKLHGLKPRTRSITVAPKIIIHPAIQNRRIESATVVERVAAISPLRSLPRYRLPLQSSSLPIPKTRAP